MKNQFLIIALFIPFSLLWSQTGGRNAFNFLNLSPSARMTALSGVQISWPGYDNSSAYQNPALLTEKQHTQLSFNHQNYFAGLSNGDASYSHKLPYKNIMLMGGIHYANYGEFTGADEFGNKRESFNGKDNALYVAGSYILNERITVGLTTQFISSTLAEYNSSGLAFNAGVVYFNPDKKFGLGLVAKHMGTQFSKYYQTSESLPFEVQLGFSKRLKHLPLIYTITATNLDRANNRYDDPDLQDSEGLFGEAVKEKSEFNKAIDNIFRHLRFSTELFIGKKETVVLRAGYSHLRKRELGVKDYQNFSGISFGFGVKIYKFKIDYGFANYHKAGAAHQFGISTNLNTFVKPRVESKINS